MVDVATTTIRNAVETDLPSVLRLVEAAGLPAAGIADHFDGFVVAVDPGSGHLLACGGLEPYGSGALLRSVAVSEEVRGSGLGARIVTQLLDDAARDGVEEVWLLTETAGDWFPRFGFVPATRDDIPAALGASEELRGACPDSAAVLVRRT